MAQKSRNILKPYFEATKRPTQNQFEDLIDSFVNREDDSFVETLPDANTSQKGIVQQANPSEAEAGSNDNKFVTPKGVKEKIENFAPGLAPVQSVNNMTGDVFLDLGGEDTGWQTPSLLNGITNHSTSYQAARFRKKNSIVYIDGVVKGGTATGTVTIFKLPIGYRPSKRTIFCTSRSNGVFRIDVASNGDLICFSYDNIWTSISGISFLVD